MKARRDRRSAERKWRASRLNSDFAVFKAKRNFVLHVMNESRWAYYKQYIDENSSDQGRLFRASKRLLNLHEDRALPPHTDARMLANEMGEYFVHKITAIRSELDADASDATSLATSTSTYSEFSEFSPLSEESVRRIAASCAKSCALDPLPSSILTFCLDELLPVIRKIVNLSLESGVFAEDWKNALVHPLLKKAGLKPINKNFRPVSNLQVTSKITEKSVAIQLQDHMTANNLFPVLQSAYRQNHSTETVLLKVKNDLLLNMDKGHVTLLVMLDLSAAFDTVDHGIVLHRLQSKLGLREKALLWFKSYLTGRTQQVSVNGTLSDKFNLTCGVPQGSCLGPLLFTIYSSSLFDIMKFHLPSVHTYADDTQLYISFNPFDNSSEADAVIAIENCIRDVRAWMRDDKLMLNDDKTEFLIIGTERQLSRVSVDKIKIGQAEVSPVSSVRNLGAWFDSHLDMSTHVTKACASAFYYLYNIRHIRKYLSHESTERLVHAFITSRLDYCNGLLYGAPEYQIKKLQRVMNASARLVYRAPKYCLITPLLRELHWLPVRLRVDFKILLVTLKVLHGVAPIYLKDLVSVLPDSHYQLRRNNNGILLERPRLRTKKTMGDRAFSIAAPILWNSLPLPIRQETSIDSFKRSVKTYLFKKAFS